MTESHHQPVTKIKRAIQDFLHEKNVLVYGVGLQGGGEQTIQVLFECGAHITLVDDASAEKLAATLSRLPQEVSQTLTQPNESILNSADLILKNPAVPFEADFIQAALQRNIPVTTELALAFEFMAEKAIAITGTRGKTTTTHLIFHILQTAGLPVVLCGNIPHKPTLAKVFSAPENSLFVVEVPSFHIEALAQNHCSPHVAVVTNVFPDHLNRYESIEAYAQTKADLFRFQKPGDLAFWHEDHEWAKTLADAIQPGVIAHSFTKQELKLRGEEYITNLPGAHNAQNAALASLVAEALGIEKNQILQALASFVGVSYRQEKIAEFDGCQFINDTTSTTPIALEKALDTFPWESTLFIVGGTTKHLPFSPEFLQKMSQANSQQRIIWLKGSGTDELLQQIEKQENEPLFSDLSLALKEAWKRKLSATKTPINTIVLSPGFSSFELFTNEFHRGDVFNELVRSQSFRTE